MEMVGIALGEERVGGGKGYLEGKFGDIESGRTRELPCRVLQQFG